MENLRCVKILHFYNNNDLSIQDEISVYISLNNNQKSYKS